MEVKQNIPNLISLREFDFIEILYFINMFIVSA